MSHKCVVRLEPQHSLKIYENVNLRLICGSIFNKHPMGCEAQLA